MQENIYATPESSLDNPEQSPVEHAFYVVSVPKFLTLYFFTFGFYGFYWHYKNWAQYKIAYADKSPMPFWRAVFSLFFTHSLFNTIDTRLMEKGIDFKWNPTVWATIAVVAQLASRIIDRVTADGDMTTPIEYAPFPLMIVYGLVLLKAQRVINLSCMDPDGNSNRTFTLANCAWIFLGAVIFSLIAVVIFTSSI